MDVTVVAERHSLPRRVRFQVLHRDGFACVYCGRRSPEVTLEPDHLLPVAAGGTNDPSNLVTSCWDCNRGKGDQVRVPDGGLISVSAQRRGLVRVRTFTADGRPCWEYKPAHLVSSYEWYVIAGELQYEKAKLAERIARTLAMADWVRAREQQPTHGDPACELAGVDPREFRLPEAQ